MNEAQIEYMKNGVIYNGFDEYQNDLIQNIKNDLKTSETFNKYTLEYVQMLEELLPF